MKPKHAPVSKASDVARLSLAVFLAIAALSFVMSCDDDSSNPARNPDCGSGVVDWDSKALVCRDRSNGIVVPSSCCGR